ncbi:uncharacterized protein LOC113347124 [Papaver somniferum]|uniref:uncharacterized protein LOC113347124 n=1 Tax=Papaver somniferum TaxID=3469 RepID=UPI000E6F9CC4|nr:uncharacterized protein LOC113347124 [Papaver somniferum]
MAENLFVRDVLQTINGETQAVITNLTKFHYFFFSTKNEFLNAVIAASYSDLLRNKFSKKYVAHTTIMVVQDDHMDEINRHTTSLFPGEERQYLSKDYISFATENYNEAKQLYPTEFLNKVEIAYMPKHELRLKIGLPITLLRCLDEKKGIITGTRLIITQLLEHEIVAEVLTGPAVGKKVVIGKHVMKSTNAIPLTRCQFPVKIAIVMHMDRSRGQSLHNAGFYFKSGSFDEDNNLAYIGISNTGKGASKTKITIIKKNDLLDGYTKTTVHQHIPDNSSSIDRMILQI